ncbi:Fe-S cluster assembly protein SufD [Virgibacillus halodenitrificans]|uniref:Fe-S cluster assembly protein SufD n=1 Tax=Virgibacillus halodenitrificans TaxID=1482 RepID=A0AAC9IZX1_VIRHA|nr:Fe-S cluster assembly protein SufD [Virgibacillus halodenitrificans]APC48996.1 Fe-S cluster assembly protein SufD [Virgibacillus halodenitrificans]MBD1223376.1 Fe-S cluster assembly protein SufD [Virgibacillus halodenitrificans]MCJ0932704.1 Fe-S cluster assembly protein SufD [Virgibacillus halodenitrificans]MEC2159002.1 Fe-S cluster assembly protein SufD [Virgibacillus halodenitrificans]MYL46034.1 Fe-S cluster assembly protein SufD [Virgibacillus halodenitrificans]
MTVETKLPYDKSYVENYSVNQNEPAWMKELRLQALEQAEHLEMPKPDKTKINRWNFTRFKHGAEGETFSSLKELPAELEEFLDKDNAPENLLIQRNNSVAYSTLSKELRDKGVIFTDIFTALKEHGELVQRYYMKDAVSVDEHRLTALHAALMNGGIFVHVPKNVQIDVPIQTIFWQEDPEAALFNHVLVVAEENSSLTYVENYISQNQNEETVANIVTEVIAQDNAKISFGAVDNFASGTTVYNNRRGVAYRDATIDWALGQMNDGNTVSENITHLIGDNAVSNAKTVSVGRGKQIQNFTAKIVHFGKNSEGHILQHGVMKESATSIFNGIGKIEHGASKSNAEQESRVLMLSEKARGDANPILLIDEDDVTAGHAASVGRVDPLQLYYLMSRGISQAEAERLIIHGFLAPVVNQLPIESVKNQLTQVIERKVY